MPARARWAGVAMTGLVVGSYVVHLRQANAALERQIADLKRKNGRLADELELVQQTIRFKAAAPRLGDHPDARDR